jgi:hypothetical protein
MPFKRYRGPRRRQNQSVTLTSEVRRQLETGRPMFSCTPPLGDDQLAEAWERWGGTILAEFVERHPGRRPFAWWLFEGVPAYGERPVVDHSIPARALEQMRIRGVLHTWAYPPIQEEEPEFLARVGEVSKKELARWESTL